MLQPPAHLPLARTPDHFQVFPNHPGYPLVRCPGLGGVLHLQIAVLGRERVEHAAAGFLGLVLQFSNQGQTVH